MPLGNYEIRNYLVPPLEVRSSQIGSGKARILPFVNGRSACQLSEANCYIVRIGTTEEVLWRVVLARSADEIISMLYWSVDTRELRHTFFAHSREELDEYGNYLDMKRQYRVVLFRCPGDKIRKVYYDKNRISVTRMFPTRASVGCYESEHATELSQVSLADMQKLAERLNHRVFWPDCNEIRVKQFVLASSAWNLYGMADELGGYKRNQVCSIISDKGNRTNTLVKVVGVNASPATASNPEYLVLLLSPKLEGPCPLIPYVVPWSRLYKLNYRWFSWLATFQGDVSQMSSAGWDYDVYDNEDAPLSQPKSGGCSLPGLIGSVKSTSRQRAIVNVGDH